MLPDFAQGVNSVTHMKQRKHGGNICERSIRNRTLEKLRNVEFHNLHSTPDISSIVKGRR